MKTKEEMKKYSKNYREKNKEEITAKRKIYYQKNREKRIKHYQENKEYYHIKNKEYKDKNRENYNIKAKEYYRNLPEEKRQEYLDYFRNYYQKNKEKVKTSIKKNQKEKVKNRNYLIQWRNDLICLKQTPKMDKIGVVGYTKRDFINHMEILFKEGMDWDNYGVVWCIDHVKSIKDFDPTSTSAQVNALYNLQPLFISENKQKYFLELKNKLNKNDK